MTPLLTILYKKLKKTTIYMSISLTNKLSETMTEGVFYRIQEMMIETDGEKLIIKVRIQILEEIIALCRMIITITGPLFLIKIIQKIMVFKITNTPQTNLHFSVKIIQIRISKEETSKGLGLTTTIKVAIKDFLETKISNKKMTFSHKNQIQVFSKVEVVRVITSNKH